MDKLYRQKKTFKYSQNITPIPKLTEHAKKLSKEKF